MEQAEHRELLEWLLECGVLTSAARATMARMRSHDRNVVLRIDTGGSLVSVKSGPSLAGDRERLLWLADRLPVPRVLAWRQRAQLDDLVMTSVAGDDLADMARTGPPERIVELIASDLRQGSRGDRSLGCDP